MAIIQSTGFHYAMARGFLAFDSTAANNRIKIYQNLGNMPADADNWSSAGSGADELATFADWTIDSVTGSTPADPVWGTVTFAVSTGLPNPSTVQATATGTAAWYAMYNTNDEGSVILGEVSLAGGTGTLVLDSLSLTSGSDTTIQTWAINFIA